MKINFITSVLILIAILLGIYIAKEACHKNAQLNEYEYLLADAWQAQQNCMGQLGVFYKEPNTAK